MEKLRQCNLVGGVLTPPYTAEESFLCLHY